MRSALLVLSGIAMMAGSLRTPLFELTQVEYVTLKRLVQEWMYYNVTFLSANYFNVGFVRRGFGGTIAVLLSSDPYTGAFMFHILSALLLIASFLVLGWRLFAKAQLPAAAFMMLFCVVSPQLFLGWGNDIARTDMMVIACIMFAAIALEADHPIVAASLLVVGFMAHETALIFGMPLLFAIALIRTDKGVGGVAYLLPHTVGLVAAVSVVALIQGAATPDVDVFARKMIDHTPSPATPWFQDLRDCAVYMMITGSRGLKTAICYNLSYKAYAVMIGFTLFVAAVNGLILRLERRWILFTLTVIAPTVFMDLIANDFGRWVKFGCASSWMLSAMLQERGTVSIDGWRLVASALLLSVLLYMGGSRVHTVNRASESVARMLGYPDAPEVGKWMSYCDPAWRSMVRPRGQRAAIS